jgi:hypothetical protein
VDVAVRDGLIPLTPVRGFKTVGEWLTEELRWELGENAGAVWLWNSPGCSEEAMETTPGPTLTGGQPVIS